jgi:NADPH:quinone reductase-like Zn-dependent oxidoreductase
MTVWPPKRGSRMRSAVPGTQLDERNRQMSTGENDHRTIAVEEHVATDGQHDQLESPAVREAEEPEDWSSHSLTQRVTRETQMRAVRFKTYGGVDVLEVVSVPDPVPGPGEVLVRVKAAGINPGETVIRTGMVHDIWPATFPSGEGSDLAGVVERVGRGVECWHPCDEVIGFTDNRASHAELVVVEAENLTRRPAAVPWDAAGALFVAGTTAWATVRAVGASAGDVVAVSGAAGGVGTIAVQLARNAGATVIGLASESHHDWLRDHGVIPVAYGEDVAERIRTAAKGQVNAMIDCYGSGYVDLAIELGITPERIDTIIDDRAAARYGAKTDGSAACASANVLAELAQLIANGKLDIPIAATYPLEQVRDAYHELEQRHTLGKIVLQPESPHETPTG